jgi:hypothetical protein
MHIDNVKVTDTVHLGDNNYKKIECSVNLAQGESANEAELLASGFIEDALRRKYPYLFTTKPVIKKEEQTYFDIPTEYRPGNDLNTSSPDFIKMQIETCTSLAVLKAVYPRLIKGNIELETIYNQKLDELSK